MAFYECRSYIPFWSGYDSAEAIKKQLIEFISDSAAKQGLDKDEYLSRINNADTITDSLLKDLVMTDIACSYLNDLYAGKNTPALVSSDELTKYYTSAEHEELPELLSEINTPGQLGVLINKVESPLVAYRLLKNELARELDSGRSREVNQLRKSLNCYRWISHFGFRKFIVINIAAAELNYYENDSIVLNMKVIAGKPTARTPRFATWCNKIIIYPYWYVPRRIAASEILPLCRANANGLKRLNMQLIDNNGKIINPYNVNWSAYRAKNFPYTFRQLPGVNNSLGIIKFNLTSPYSIYLHDTNQKNAFDLPKRYLSHGCIRLENPLQLAEHLLYDQTDTAALANYINQEKTAEINLREPVPVFILYMTADIDKNKKVKYYADTYFLN